MEKNIAVIGAGAWGTTLAVLLGKKGCQVKLWVHAPEQASRLKKERENKIFLPGVPFPNSLSLTHKIEEAISGAELIVLAVPSQFVRETCQKIKPYFDKNAIVVNVAKGLENTTLKRMSEVVKEVLPTMDKYVVLSGPNHAEEVSREIPTATVIASTNQDILKTVEGIFSTPYFKVYPLDDVPGLEICGAYKNVVALAVGICRGLGLGDNAVGSILTFGLTEMNALGRHYGAKQATCYGLAGVGDLVATCTSKHSRNRTAGQLIAQGKTIGQLHEELKGKIAEGIYTVKAVFEISQKHQLDMPLTAQIYKVLYEEKDLKSAVNDLISLL